MQKYAVQDAAYYGKLQHKVVNLISKNYYYISFPFLVENKIEAGNSGAINAIIDAIYTNINNANMCKDGCTALSSIIKTNGKNFIIKLHQTIIYFLK